MKTLNNILAGLAIAAAATIFSLVPAATMAQSDTDLASYTEELGDYYYGPIESEGYILTMYTETVDFTTIDQEELGYAILGGLIMSYCSADKRDNIGVIIVGTEVAVAMGMEKKTMKKFIKGRITVDELLAETTSVSLDLEDVPSFNASLFEPY